MDTGAPIWQPGYQCPDRLRARNDRPGCLDTDELAVAAVSIAEYRVGIELADTPAT